MRFLKTKQYYMLNRVKEYLDKKKNELYPKVPVLKKLIPEYFKKFEEVQKLVIGKIKVTSLATSQKKQAKGGLIDSTLKLVDVLRTDYAAEGDSPLPEEATYTLTQLNRATIETLQQICSKVIAAVKNVNNIVDYGISIGDIKEAEAYLEEFKAVKKAPKVKREEIANRNQVINDSIRSCMLFLENKIDPMMRMATRDNHELKLGYFSFRKVLQRGAGNIEDKEARYRKSRKKASAKQKAKKVSKKVGK